MMNAQLPSGLQALLEASQVLQQQASPMAPGPQGPQPTVANKVNQQIQKTTVPQDVIPGMRDMGQQAGIAGQIMAQRQAQQQQIAQNPQAVAQMAAQMLQHQGVAGLPANIQFKEGGIIGFDGEGPSYVKDEDAERIQEEIERELSKRFGAPASQRAAQSRDTLTSDNPPQINFTPINSEFVDVDGSLVPRTNREREVMQRMQEVRQEAERRRVAFREAEEKIAAARALQQSAKPMAAGASQLEDFYRPYPNRGPMRSHISGLPSLVSEQDIGTQNLTGPMERTVSGDEVPPSAVAPTVASAPPVVSDSSGVATLVPKQPPPIPSAEMPTYPGLSKLLANVPKTDADIEQAFKELQQKNQAILERKRASPEFEQQGIAALQRAEQERLRQLQASRGQDDWTRLRAFFRDLATRGNSYDAMQAGMDARDAGAAKAALAHEQAVIELRKAKEAREIGNLELERNYKDNAFKFLKDEREVKNGLAKLEGQLQSEYDKMTASEKTAFANRQSSTQLEMSRQSHQAMLEMSRQAQQTILETAKLKQQAELTRDTKLAGALSGIISRLTQANEEIRKIDKDYPMIAMASQQDIEKNQLLREQRNERDRKIRAIQENIIEPAIEERERIQAQLSGVSSNVIVDIGGTKYRFPNQAAADKYQREVGRQ